MPRRWLAPEVIQASAMDCGPACAASMLLGLGVPFSYGRLREACQVGLDGTALSTLEALLQRAGFDAAEALVPVDHVLRPEAGNLPAIVGVDLPGGATHFVVVWRAVGPWVQVMDPAQGRAWVRREDLLLRLSRVTVEVATEEWETWASTADFQAPLAAALAPLGVQADGSGWRALAETEAAGRAVRRLRRAGVVRQAEVQGVVAALLGSAPEPLVEEVGPETLAYTGAALVRVRGRTGDIDPDLSGLMEPPTSSLRIFADLLREHVRPAPLAALAALVTFGALVEVVLLRGMTTLLGDLGVLGFQLGLIAGVGLLGLALGAWETAWRAGSWRMGAALETSLRVRLLRAIPRLGERYFGSRPVSDLVDRAHSLRVLHALPGELASALQAALELVAVVVGLIWLDPGTAPLTLAVGAAAIATPMLAYRGTSEATSRLREHAGALSMFHLDVLRGLAPIRAQGGEATIAAQHEERLGEWHRSLADLGAATVRADQIGNLVGALGAAALVGVAASRSTGPLLLQVWWALQIPAIGQRIAGQLRQLPQSEHVARRLIEPLHATPEHDGSPVAAGGDGAVQLTLRDVGVTLGGHSVLRGVHLHLAAGEHVAVIGASGAGKSSLLAVLLGLYPASEGEIVVDGRPLEPASLRERTAWVDPTVHLWPGSLFENLQYGGAEGTSVLEEAELIDVLGGLPEGLETPLGSGGGRLSGGQGQRVRLARALGRRGAGLVLLDEPFRGLDRDARTRLMGRVRALHARATILAVTHDVRDTRAFARVIVFADGAIVEDGPPDELVRAGGAYAEAVAEAARLDAEVWSSGWRRLHVKDGGVLVDPG